MPTSDVPDVSVVVIVYNDEERLPRAVRSVLDQTLNNLEVIIADDCSTDGTERVARALEASDPRVRYARLEQNSGGCSAPRNRGIAVARAPYVMFLDSDDELPRHACKSMLLVAEETGVDFVTGEVTRLYEATDSTGLWYPHLFTEQRVVEGIAERPEYFFDHLSTNKLYRTAFIRENGLAFPEGIHYEDQLFSAQAYTLAETFAVVPWPVYTWRLAPESVSISSSRHKIQNVRDRIGVARLIDAWLEERGDDGLRAEKDYKFLRHDFRLYLGDLPFRDADWIAEFAAEVTPYLDEIADETYERLSREERVCVHLLRTGRLEEAAVAARQFGRPQLAPRAVTEVAGVPYWGAVAPADDASRRELDLSEWHLREQGLGSGRLRHELTSVSMLGPVMRLEIRTYDPVGLITEDTEASAKLAAHKTPLTVPLTLVPDGEGQYVSRAELDLRKVPVGKVGVATRRHPVIALEQDGARRTDILLARHDQPDFRATLRYHTFGIHHLRVQAEQKGAGRLEVTWQRSGVLKSLEPLGPYARKTKAKVGKVKKIIVGNEGKATAYDAVAKLPRKRGLAVFEAIEGRGYADNPRYVYEELKRRNLPIDVIWAYSGSRDSFPDDVTLVKRGSFAYGRALARATYWVDSHNLPYLYRKPKGTRYLQTWHGQTFKAMGFDVPSLRGASEIEKGRFRAAVGRWDALVCPSAEFERTFVPAFEVTADLIRSGYPRNDVLVRWAEPEQRARAAAVRESLGIPADRKVLLYAPTFRDAARRTGQSIRVDFEELAPQLSDEWIVVVRAHPYDRFKVDPELGHFLRDGSAFADVNDLMLASDAVLTDYSSLMFDYANTGRPILLYTDDYEDYKGGDRGTYYDLEDIAPGPMLTTTEELAAAVRDLEGVQKRHAERYTRFQEMFCSYETGHASKLVVDAFFEGGTHD
ncbi:bifunctional glycosyltransferase/CDP-glycerol:glycerophosphate glycerophosphotransferase [Streptomyces stackebrandtii]|uniref:bifunctional glycosyltransferase/CDP-glycerol:glycerophosphate glycerophosphotransferase n=1 Tax=Streptomyces stackebrandtii TaxID=3051177 RepID=UPI0028DB8F07|nr:CDP-glycerol glycerophosphotransferase family protein [Streptomyces sp. DSM 40976]